MKEMVTTLMIVSIVFCLVSCSPAATTAPAIQKSKDALDAEQALTDFLNSLQKGNFEEAAKLYGGSYDVMIEQNPNIDPSNQAAYLNNACTINGYQCLEIKSVEPEREISANEFTFKVELQNADGTLFISGGCCGGNETDSPARSSFIFNVIKERDGKFRVMDMPPYMP